LYGDIITATVDMDNHTLSYTVNDIPLPIAFNEVPSEGVWFAYSAGQLGTEVKVK